MILSKLRPLHTKLYRAVCGTPPALRPWHFQWLIHHRLFPDIARFAPELAGRVLDVGCGQKPYRAWLKKADPYVGIDTSPESAADAVITPGAPWPFPASSFDGVLCTQVLEHAVDCDHVLAEIHRVLRPGGTLVLSIPFIYNHHGGKDDYWRFSTSGVRAILGDGYEIRETKAQGGFGTSLVTLSLNWIEIECDRHTATAVLKAALLPLWALVCAFANGAGLLLDKIDTTGAFYANVLVVAKKR